MKAIFIDPVIAMLHNQKTDRWHPILFVGSPLPGGVSPRMRHKSKGHHTEGFDTQEQANKAARELAEQVYGSRLLLEPPAEWDGLDMPAMVKFFPDRAPDQLTGEQSLTEDVKKLIEAARTLCDQVAYEVPGAHMWPAVIYLRAAATKVERSSVQPPVFADRTHHDAVGR